jgi:hypothetical protein
LARRRSRRGVLQASKARAAARQFSAEAFALSLPCVLEYWKTLDLLVVSRGRCTADDRQLNIIGEGPSHAWELACRLIGDKPTASAYSAVSEKATQLEEHERSSSTAFHLEWHWSYILVFREPPSLRNTQLKPPGPAVLIAPRLKTGRVIGRI